MLIQYVYKGSNILRNLLFKNKCSFIRKNTAVPFYWCDGDSFCQPRPHVGTLSIN